MSTHTKTNEQTHCPKCHTDLDGGSIWEYFYKFYNGDEAKADETAAMYGATRTEGRWKREIGIYDYVADRTMSWRCPDCGHEWPR